MGAIDDGYTGINVETRYWNEIKLENYRFKHKNENSL